MGISFHECPTSPDQRPDHGEEDPEDPPSFFQANRGMVSPGPKEDRLQDGRIGQAIRRSQVDGRQHHLRIRLEKGYGLFLRSNLPRTSPLDQFSCSRLYGPGRYPGNPFCSPTFNTHDLGNRSKADPYGSKFRRRPFLMDRPDEMRPYDFSPCEPFLLLRLRGER